MRIWFSRKKDSKDIPTSIPLKEVDDPVILHNHDLAKWNYLGYTRCTYIDENGNIQSEHPIFLFVNKNNEKRRSYYVSSEYVDKNHQFINKSVKPWAVGEGEIYYLIKGEGNQPSDYLKEYMLEQFNCEWDTSKNWWGSSDDAKYTAASNKQNRERRPKAKTTTETNVVAVDFGKQA